MAPRKGECFTGSLPVADGRHRITSAQSRFFAAADEAVISLHDVRYSPAGHAALDSYLFWAYQTRVDAADHACINPMKRGKPNAAIES